MKNLLTASLLCITAVVAHAQTAPVFTSSCEYGQYTHNDRQRHCETRDLVLAAPKSGALTIDGQRNGGISVKSWAGKDVRVRARVQTWGNDEAAAKAQAAGIQISTANNMLQATAPDGENDWAVSYEVFVPEKMALALKTHNGGISLQDVRGPVTFEAQNGGVNISGSGGDVRGRTQNGGLHITLAGKKWEGKGLDVATQNGGISWKLPADYSAQFISSTQHGSVDTDFGTSVKGKIGREIAVNLGQGGAPVKAVTTNGGISVRRAE
ncbi:DUF4097 family beta strand repeat-containing protein [Hymenobacter metallicola]|uniref:Adhesin domain-containing protein n=1 Tax=Hymenobacter metallicola TaxID=2563114 RepID=A0A4Z0QHJ4_9BACT|nr:hypothetical protein [Hymenobacter metallicola]TGE29244.1 hypothetical protein E5K02_07260 [Hymenobacter metallicola]